MRFLMNSTNRVKYLSKNHLVITTQFYGTEFVIMYDVAVVVSYILKEKYLTFTCLCLLLPPGESKRHIMP